MQQYKFRGKRKDLKDKWVYGSLITTPDGVYILEEGDSVEFIEPEYHSTGMGCGLEDRNITDRYTAMQHGFERAAEKAAENHPPFIEVIPETVGMWTGLKDRDGTEVWEGDLYHTDATPSKDRYQIMFVSGAFVGGKDQSSCSPLGWQPDNEGDDLVLDNTEKWLKVVGNIHDNPELITPANKTTI